MNGDKMESNSIFGECGPVITIRIIMLGLLLASSAGATTLTVCLSGCEYSSIQKAINAASNGDTIKVHNGTYNEKVNVSKQVTLRGIGMPEVNSMESGNAITLSANGVRLKNFMITSDDILYYDQPPESGIYVNSNDNIIKNNTVSNYHRGIYLKSSSNNTLRGNNVSNNEIGIFLISSRNNILIRNNVLNNAYYGIYLSSSRNNILIRNNVLNNDIGIYLWYLNSNNNIYNNFFNNIKNIDIREASSYRKMLGIASNNSENGLLLEYSARNNRSYNNFSQKNNLIYNFISNYWNITKTSGKNIIGGPYLGGNFWALPNGTGFSQTCKDTNNDGICDAQYILDSKNIDYLPLVQG